MNTGDGDQGREPLEQLQRREQHGGRAIGPRAPNLVEELAPRSLRQPVEGQRGAQQRAAEVLPSVPAVGGGATSASRLTPSSRAPRGGASDAATAEQSWPTGWPARGPRGTPALKRGGHGAGEQGFLRREWIRSPGVLREAPSATQQAPDTARQETRRRTRSSSVGGGVAWNRGGVGAEGRV